MMFAMDERYNVLTTKVISVKTRDGEVARYTLPEVLELLGAGQVEGFPMVREYQQHLWYMTLCHFAVLASETPVGPLEIRVPASAWRERLEQLAGGSAWDLFNATSTEPAYMQPADKPNHPSGMASRFEEFYEKRRISPIDLDFPINNRDHINKLHEDYTPGVSPEIVERWLITLTCLQMGAPFGGKGHYQAVRGDGQVRLLVEVSPTLDINVRWSRMVHAMLAEAPKLIERYNLGTTKLGWLIPDDPASGLPVAKCHPYILEAPRRLRLLMDNGSISALAMPGTRRIEDPDYLLARIDPWGPTVILPKSGDQVALRASRNGENPWSYQRQIDLALGSAADMLPCLSMQMMNDDEREKPRWLILQAIEGEKGKCRTHGYHKVLRRLPPEFFSALEETRNRHQIQVDHLGKFASAVRRAWAQYRSSNDRVDPKLSQMDYHYNQLFREADEIAYRVLLTGVALSREEFEQMWAKELTALAQRGKEMVCEMAGPVGHGKYRGRVFAERSIGATVYKLTHPEV